MRLDELIVYFRQITGRQNLDDARVKAAINGGIEYLAPLLDGHYKNVMLMTSLKEGSNLVDLSQTLGSVTNVWRVSSLMESGASFVEIPIYFDFSRFVADYPNQSETGEPSACVKAPNMLPLTADKVPTGLLAGETYEAKMFDGTSRLILLFNKVAEADFMLRVQGPGRLGPLETDDAFNLLSVQSPLLIVNAALFIVEVGQRQYDEAGKIEAVIADMIRAITIPSIEAEAAQLGGQIDG